MRNTTIFKDMILFTIIPFAIPFIIEIPEDLISTGMKWLIIVLATVSDFYFAYKSLVKKEQNKINDFVQKSIRYAYSGAHEIVERKTDSLSHETEFHTVDISTNFLPYDIHSHIVDICKEFKKVIASITGINNEFITTTFIYRYVYDGCCKNDNQWKWIGNREPISKVNLNYFVQKKGTTYYPIINENTHYIFGNSKEELAKQNCYYIGGKDKMYNNVGSIFSIKVAFGNNVTTFIEGIITITTHGKYFTEYLDINDASNVLRDMIINEIFPYYRKLIETELGLLYIRHSRCFEETNQHNHQRNNDSLNG